MPCKAMAHSTKFYMLELLESHWFNVISMSSAFAALMRIRKHESAFDFSVCFIGLQDSVTLGWAFVTQMMFALGDSLSFALIFPKM